MDPLSSQHKETMLVCSKPNQDQKKPRPQPEEAQKCPRCESTNTKFCYYNNYSLSQPRYFCKSCRRYWTKGGTLRNVPVGGGCRKNRRSSSSSSSAKIRSTQDQLGNNDLPVITGMSNLNSCDQIDLSLAFALLQKQSSSSNGNGLLGFGFDLQDQISVYGKPSNSDIDFLGNPTGISLDHSPRNGLFRTQNDNYHNLGYGFGNLGDHQDRADVMMPRNEETSTTTSASVNALSLSRENESSNPSKVFWGYQWQMNGENSFKNMGNSDHISSTWHGLLNSPLMQN